MKEQKVCLFQTLQSEQIFLQTGDKSLQFCDFRLFLVIYENCWVGKPCRTGRSFLVSFFFPLGMRYALISAGCGKAGSPAIRMDKSHQRCYKIFLRTTSTQCLSSEKTP